eukprot:m.18817 g.18817  ORF g.18817 m.18817 type:complete len:66 (+) comp8556_c0_seq2:153-350(+)
MEEVDDDGQQDGDENDSSKQEEMERGGGGERKEKGPFNNTHDHLSHAINTYKEWGNEMYNEKGKA